MTIDITIGKLVKRDTNEMFEDDINLNYNNCGIYSCVDIIECPPEDDGCTKEDTMCPGKSYRSGSNSGMHKFFMEVMDELYDTFMEIKSNDFQMVQIKKIIEKLNNVEYNGDNFYHKRILHWFKFWCNKSLELYGDDAVVGFM